MSWLRFSAHSLNDPYSLASQSENKNESIINHLFLPHHLLGSSDVDHLLRDDHRYEYQILESMKEFLRTLQEDNSLPIFTLLHRCTEKWVNVQNPKNFSAVTLQATFTNLKPGEFFSLYFQTQNAAILVEIEEDRPDEPLLSSWQVLLPTEIITSSIQSHLSSFPVPTFRLSDPGQLKSQVHSELLVDFMENTIEYNKTQKSAYSFDETRNVAVSHYVCQWWISQFQGIQLENPIESPLKFTKKHRDQIRWKSSRLPFRRSGLWMTIKTVFHSILAKRLGYDGVVIYKLMITKFLLYTIKTTQETSKSQIYPDLLVHCLRKIARRLTKIDKLTATIKSVEIRQWVDETMVKLENDLTRLFPSDDWEKMFRRESLRIRATAVVREKNIELEDCQQPCTRVNAYLNSNTRANGSYYDDFSFYKRRSYEPSSSSNIFNKNQLPSLSTMRYETNMTNVVKLTRSELWIRSHFEEWITNVFSSRKGLVNNFEQLISFFEDYQRAAIQHYCSGTHVWDPIGYSRFILTALTIIRHLHSRLCQEENFERLKLHRIEIPHLSEIFPYLVLPDRDDMIYAQDLYDYFMAFKQGPYPDLLSNIESHKAFGVYFAANSEDMTDTLSQIREEAEEDKRDKIVELITAKERYNILIESIADKKCECETLRFVRCDRCDTLRQANNIKVSIYECPIPKKTESALAVVFELKMPIEIRCYRDILWRFINRNDSGTTNHMYEWLSVSPHSGKLRRFCQHSYQPRVKLVSSQKSISQSHYSAPRPIGITPFEDYLFENSLQVQISPTKPTSLQDECRYLTPQLNESNYKCLQFALNNTDFVQNQVIAQLSNCSLRLKPSQFVDFGSFRSGHRLQWWNLLSALELDSLAMDEESVTILLMHSLLQYGPVAISDDTRLDSPWCSETHEIILDDDFLDELILRLNRRLIDCQDNWQSELVLLILTIIISRLFTLCNETRMNQVLELMLKCRQTGERWIKLINEYIQHMSSTSFIKADVLREKMVIIAITCLLTFSTHADRLRSVLSCDDHVISLLKAATTMHDNAILTKESNRSAFFNYLNRFIKHLLICIHPSVNKLVEKNSFQLLNEYCALYWTELRNKTSTNGTWKKRNSDEYDGWYDGQYDSVIVSIDCLNGAFLVDGMSVGFLPQRMTSNSLFTRVFGDHVFEVLASGTHEHYITKHTYHGERDIHYEFSFDNRQDRLTVHEQHGLTKDKFQLIPADCFHNELPEIFVTNYSHWRNMTTDEIEFRPIRFHDANFLTEKQYVLNLKTGFITTKTAEKTQTLIRQNSAFSENLYACFFNRLDERTHVYMLKDETQSDEDPIIHIHLSRLGIAFRYNLTTNQITSREYTDMHIDENQWFGTLTGLKAGLLLSPISRKGTEKTNVVGKKLIVPFGQVRISRPSDKQNHQEVTIDRSSSSTSFLDHYFVFILNDRLRILQSTESPAGWLYLALLHAMTSNALPDQYTGMTGMERAFQLLNSAGCWSDQPYNPLCLNILLQIASISPKATFYPEHLTSMIKVEFHSQSLPYSLQHFGYYLLAKQLFDSSEQLNFMHSSHNAEDAKKFFENKKCHEKPLTKLYWDYRDSYNPTARLSEQMERNILQSVSTQRYQSIWNSCPRTTTYTRRNLVDHLYNSGNVSLKDSSELKIFPLSRWLNAEYQLKNTWIGLFKLAHEMKTKNTENLTDKVERFELLLNFLHYISEKCNINPYYLQMLRSILNVTNVLLPSVTYPQWIQYENIEEVSFQHHRIKLPRKLYHRGRMEATDEIRKCYDQNTYYRNDSLPTWNINTITINRLFETWRTNAKLRSRVHAIQMILNSIPILPLHSLTCVNPQQFTVEEFRQHYQIALHSKKSTIEPLLLSSARKKFLFRHTDYFVKPKPIIRIDREHKTFPDQIFPSIDQQINSISSIAAHFKQQLNESWKNYNATEEYQYEYPSVDEIKQHLASLRKESSEFWDELEESIMNSYASVFETGCVLRVTPNILISLLQKLQEGSQSSDPLIVLSVHLSNEQRVLLGGLMINWIVEQQYERALNFASHGKREDFEKEIANTPHANWIPVEHLPWLIMELEMNITIRETQVDVTKHMIQSEDNGTDEKSITRNIVMQMNMGEGKTSVILPMLALSLCSSTSTLVRIIVLKALFPMNYQSLRYKLGGLLNRRVFPFACRRDMNFNHEQINRIYNRFQDALRRCDVIITSPEDLLSFDLLTIDKCRRNELDTSQSMLQTQHWLKRHARDVLDESDEILHVKYQLIYSIGSQKQVDGGMERWQTIQTILMLTKKHAAMIADQYTDETFYRTPEQMSHFPEFRLLAAKPFQKLCENIVNDWMSRQSYRQADHRLIRSFILDTNVSISCLGERFPHNIVQLFLIVRGLLSSEVLLVALRKRYRVNYGINPSQKFNRLMAVPFRAKDVAAENTEFGHPDVAIVLTQLSYYYKGLEDSQMSKCFERLNQDERDPDMIYDEWIAQEDLKHIPPAIQRWKSINLKDSQQRSNQLFPALRRNILVVNYFLNHFVFPREAKQFPNKLVGSAWDLSSSARAHIMTGFSGTSDTQLLLPIHVHQSDLPELRKTDAIVLNNLLRVENEHYQAFPPGVTSEDILAKIVGYEPFIQVILDVGALLVGGTNRQLAMKWLNLISKERIEYAVYFEGDELYVCDRLYHHHAFITSPASERLDRCIFYLDEIHTRGTDFKFPSGFRAAVTLGNGLTKDRLVQACMRMRQLGKHHWVSFWSSYEVHRQMIALKTGYQLPNKPKESTVTDQITLHDILRWVYENTQNATWDGLHHWAVQSLSHQRKAIAYQSFDWRDANKLYTKTRLEKLARDCLESEVIELKLMYGPAKKLQKLIEIYTARCAYSQIMVSKEIHEGVKLRLLEFGGLKQLLTHLLDEEQQRELEQEMEEERQQKRPPSMKPCQPILHKEIQQLSDMKSPILDLSKLPRVFLPISAAFARTSLRRQCEPTAWRNNFWITSEFERAIETSGESLDGFLRPPRWILIYRNTHVIFLSPHEANFLMGELRCSPSSIIKQKENGDSSTLRLILPRLKPDQSILVNIPALMVPHLKTVPQFMIPIDWLTELFVFNGTLYFESIEEQTSYCKTLGLCPKPRSDVEEKAFEQGWIEVDGFFKDVMHRMWLNMTQCRFISNPLPFVRKLIESRNYAHAPLNSHVGDIILSGLKRLS